MTEYPAEVKKDVLAHDQDGHPVSAVAASSGILERTIQK
ncbi:hypothetical protein PI124_g767 [Phytophthora idaei]|nr:hypothetical protein PI125_g16636 [Phytophthora idaei]KAG3165842.1 hypothetical protein PI126_g4436 [Phytophthora idaei]KAG3254701.1 hypothetical protein PI124_g767 [Phytophthora idaei]